MRYLTLSAEYTGSPLRDDVSGPIVPEEAGLSWELGDRLREWNDRYRPIIPLELDDRIGSPVAELVATLDEEGLGLAAAIVAELGEAKVRYYSEGCLRYLP